MTTEKVLMAAQAVENRFLRGHNADKINVSTMESKKVRVRLNTDDLETAKQEADLFAYANHLETEWGARAWVTIDEDNAEDVLESYAPEIAGEVL